MKSSLTLLGVLLLTILSLTAQQPTTPQPIPELQEWWRAPANEKGLGEYGVSYIPNFYHGKDAMGVSIKNGQMETWLNRFPGDRENVFTWKGGGPVLQGDFNGDGITDYLGGFIVYRGVKNGEPPDSISVRSFPIRPTLIADVNHDGYDDIVDVGVGGGSHGFTYIGQIVYGASDFKEMKVIPFYTSKSMDTTMEMELMYKGADGDMRIIMFNYTMENDPQRPFDGYGLFRAKWNKRDTLPTYEKLASIVRYKDQGPLFFRVESVYQSKYSPTPYFLAVESGAQWTITIYNLSTDKFEETKKMSFPDTAQASPEILKASINGDKYEDWILSRRDHSYEIYSGGEILDTAKFAVYHSTCTFEGDNIGLSNFEVIGDVNGDGINDLAVALASNSVPNCFRIVLGIKPPTGVSEVPSNNENSFSLGDPTPHPLLRDKAATLTARIPKSGEYVLEVLSIAGAKVEEVSRQNMSAGEQTITIDCSHSQVSNGTYILRLSDEQGNVVGQRLIVIQ